MNSIVLLGLMLTAAPEFGEAPPDTLDAVQSINRLRAVFQNCEFTAVQTVRSAQPSGIRFTEITDVTCKACADAVVIQSTARLTDHINPEGQREADHVAQSERRWVSGGHRTQIDLSIRASDRWPADMPTPEKKSIKQVAAHSKRDSDN